MCTRCTFVWLSALSLCDPCTPAGSTHPDTGYPSVYTTYNMYRTRYTDYMWEGTYMYLRELKISWRESDACTKYKAQINKCKVFCAYIVHTDVQKNRTKKSIVSRVVLVICVHEHKITLSTMYESYILSTMYKYICSCMSSPTRLSSVVVVVHRSLRNLVATLATG